MATRIVAPSGQPPATASVDGVTKPEGLNAEQLKRVCENVAGRAATLCNLLRQIQGAGLPLGWEADTQLDAALIVAVGIGAMADEAAAPGGEIFGSHDYWNYGPNFADAGKEVSHG